MNFKLPVLLLLCVIVLLSGCAFGGEESQIATPSPFATSEPEPTIAPLPTIAPESTIIAEATSEGLPTLGVVVTLEPEAEAEPTVPSEVALKATEEGSSLTAGMACMGTFGFGMTCLNESGWYTFSESNSSLGNDLIFDLALCPDNRLLIGQNSGINAFDGTTWQDYKKGWDSSSPNAIACAEDGTIWVAHFQGVSRFKEGSWTTYPSEALSSGPDATTLMEDITIASDGTVWVATASSVAAFDGQEWTIHQENEGFSKRYFFDSIAIDSKGNPWAAHSQGLLAYDGQQWTAYDNSDFITLETLTLDIHDRLWVGTFSQGLHIFEQGAWRTYHRQGSDLLSDHVQAIAIDEQERVWIGTEWGLSIFDGKEWQSYQMQNADLADNDINSIVVLGAGPSLPATLDKATGSLSGQLVQDNESVSDATVELCVEFIGMIGLDLSDDVPCADQPLVRTVKSDNQGNFTFNDLPEGRYRLTVDLGDGNWWAFEGEYGITAEPILVKAGEETNLLQLEISEDE